MVSASGSSIDRLMYDLARFLFRAETELYELECLLQFSSMLVYRRCAARRRARERSLIIKCRDRKVREHQALLLAFESVAETFDTEPLLELKWNQVWMLQCCPA